MRSYTSTKRSVWVDASSTQPPSPPYDPIPDTSVDTSGTGERIIQPSWQWRYIRSSGSLVVGATY